MTSVVTDVTKFQPDIIVLDCKYVHVQSKYKRMIEPNWDNFTVTLARSFP